MALSIKGSANVGLIGLPWETPLEHWPTEHIAALPRGVSRHVVRFVKLEGRVVAIKETNPEIARREFKLLRKLQKQGAPCVTPLAVVTGREDFAARVGELTKGRGCDVVYDSVGAATFAGSLAALARCGHLVSYGQASGPVPPVDPAALSAKSVTLSRPVLFHYTADPAALREIAGRTFDALRRGIIRTSINQRYALRDALATLPQLEDDDFLLSKQVIYETIHVHDVVAERFGTVGVLRAELATGTPSPRQTTLAAWLYD